MANFLIKKDDSVWINSINTKKNWLKDVYYPITFVFNNNSGWITVTKYGGPGAKDKSLFKNYRFVVKRNVNR
jgi:hypothetical protein